MAFWCLYGFLMKVEPLKVIHFKHMPWSSSNMPYRLHFIVKGKEDLDGKKCKRLVRELETKLKNFHYKQDEISFYISDLDDFFFYRAAINQINGGWHSFHVHSSFSSKYEDNRREDMGRVPALIARELKSWRFSHYTTSLKITNVEPK